MTSDGSTSIDSSFCSTSKWKTANDTRRWRNPPVDARSSESIDWWSVARCSTTAWNDRIRCPSWRVDRNGRKDSSGRWLTRTRWVCFQYSLSVEHRREITCSKFFPAESVALLVSGSTGSHCLSLWYWREKQAFGQLDESVCHGLTLYNWATFAGVRPPGVRSYRTAPITIPLVKHLVNRQYWQRFRWDLSITQHPLPMQRYFFLFWTVRLKKPRAEERGRRRRSLERRFSLLYLCILHTLRARNAHRLLCHCKHHISRMLFEILASSALDLHRTVNPLRPEIDWDDIASSSADPAFRLHDPEQQSMTRLARSLCVGARQYPVSVTAGGDCCESHAGWCAFDNIVWNEVRRPVRASMIAMSIHRSYSYRLDLHFQRASTWFDDASVWISWTNRLSSPSRLCRSEARKIGTRTWSCLLYWRWFIEWVDANSNDQCDGVYTFDYFDRFIYFLIHLKVDKN